MRLFDLNVTKGEIDTIVSIKIQLFNSEIKELWFSTKNKYASYIITDRYDGFLVGMLFPAMINGEDIFIDGMVSNKLLHNINNYVIPLIMSFSNKCKKINVFSNKTVDEIVHTDGIGTGFSGGVDSFCTIYDNFVIENDKNYKINSFLFLNVGSHGWTNMNHAQEKFHNRYTLLSKFPEEVNIEFVSLNSNLHQFHPWGHQLTCTLTMVAGILILQNKYKKYYCASLGWSYIELYEFYKTDIGKDISIFDPILLPLLSTESLELIPDGTQYNRVEKTLRILNYEPVKRYLNVCVGVDEGYHNCSICSKCCRTLMTLENNGNIEDFSEIFDLVKYKKVARKTYYCQQVILDRKDPFARGNLSFAKNKGIKVPSKIFSKYYVFKRNISHLAIRYVKMLLLRFLPLDILKQLKRFNLKGKK